jgi:hypothetical protein
VNIVFRVSKNNKGPYQQKFQHANPYDSLKTRPLIEWETYSDCQQIYDKNALFGFICLPSVYTWFDKEDINYLNKNMFSLLIIKPREIYKIGPKTNQCAFSQTFHTIHTITPIQQYKNTRDLILSFCAGVSASISNVILNKCEEINMERI